MKFVIEKLANENTVAGKCHEKDGYTTHGLIKITPSNCIMPATYENWLERIRNVPVREDDVFLLSNPKCGTTWCQEMVWLIANDCDFEGAKQYLNDRFPYIDGVGCLAWSENDALDKFDELSSPRFLKSHLPKVLLPKEIWDKKCKIIFIVRDAKDAAISNYHHYQLFHEYDGSLEDFLKYTLDERVLYSPFWEHAIEFWNMRKEPNVLFLRYEELKADLTAALRKIASFFGKTLTDDNIEKLKEHLSFESMKNNRAVNFERTKELIAERSNQSVKEGSFIRSGKTGGWKQAMTVELQDKFQNWTSEKINGTGLEEFYH